MSDVDIVIYYPYIDGTTTSLIDTYLNLSRYLDVKCYVLFDSTPAGVKRNVEYVRTLRASVPVDKFKYEYVDLRKLREWQASHHSKNLIISFGILRFLNSIDFNYDNLIFLDAGRMRHDYAFNNSRLIRYTEALPNVCFAGNKANRRLFDESTVWEVWYHKFSRERMDFLRSREVVNGLVDERGRGHGDIFTVNQLSMNELIFRRWQTFDNKSYAENIGKMIFEFAALGKRVHYLSEHKTQDDGLTEYLSLFGIDDNVSQDVVIGYDELLDKLGFKDDDSLLRLIKL